MKSKITILVLVSTFAIATTGTFAQPLPAERHHSRAVAYHERPEWYQRWLLHRLYKQREGYVPDNHTCFPGACSDNPRY
jgi:hypothetical protein